MKNTFSFLIATVIIFWGCQTENNNKGIDPDGVYFDYKIWAEEDKEDVTVMVQYLSGGQDGTSILLQEPGKVSLDGEILQADSAKISGIYYEVQKPLSEFAGKHSIVFTNMNNKEFKEDFEFLPFTVVTPLPETVKRNNLTIKLQGLKLTDYLTVIITDTAFYSNDINQRHTVKNGELVIEREQLQNVASGPVTLQLFKEEERSVKNATKQGGQISITYGLTREFELAN